MLRETPEDRRKQTRLFEVASKRNGLKFKQFKSSSNKFRIDGFFYDDDLNIKLWAECKWYSGKAHLYLNMAKFNELVYLSEYSKCQSILLFREYDNWGFVVIHDGNKIKCDYEVKLLGGTPKGRVINDDDIEPLIKINRNNIIWGKKD